MAFSGHRGGIAEMRKRNQGEFFGGESKAKKRASSWCSGGGGSDMVFGLSEECDAQATATFVSGDPHASDEECVGKEALLPGRRPVSHS
jgi:hypothetical protein